MNSHPLSITCACNECETRADIIADLHEACHMYHEATITGAEDHIVSRRLALLALAAKAYAMTMPRQSEEAER